MAVLNAKATETRVLSKAQIEQFMELGHVTLPGAFPRKKALAAQSLLWDRLTVRGIVQQDPRTWREPMVHLTETYDDPEFRACDTERLADAIEDLVGPGRWRDRGQLVQWGWWPVNFSLGADSPWSVPVSGWHWDGIHFRHTIDAPDQGILALCLFSDIGPRGGGTLVAEGSHKIVARFLHQYPSGLELGEAIPDCVRDHAWLAELTGAKPSADGDRIHRFMDSSFVDNKGTQLRVVETTGEAGDVILCHPLLFHAASQNHARIPRFMCNRTAPLREPMRLDRSNGDYSPVEQSLRCAIGIE